MTSNLNKQDERVALTFFVLDGDLPADSKAAAEFAARELLQAGGADPVMAQEVSGFPEAFHLTGNAAYKMNDERWAAAHLWESAVLAACTAAGVDRSAGCLTNYPDLAEKVRAERAARKAGRASS